VLVVSWLGDGSLGLLSGLLFGGRRIGGIVKLVGTISRGVLFGFFSEAFGFELSNLGVGNLKFTLRFEMAGNATGMATLPIADVALEFVNLLPKLSVFGTELLNFTTQLVNQNGDRVKLVGERIGKEQRSMHNAS